MKIERREFLSLAAPLAFATPEFLETMEEATAAPIKGRLAVVVGHTRLRPGAYGIGAIGQHEYPFNSIMAAEIMGIGRKEGLEVRSFTRDLGGVKTAYADAIKWGADAVVELHFNATRRRIDKIRGTETLSAGGSRIASFQLADAVHRHTLRALDRPASMDRGVKTCRLRSNYDCPTILTEPVFGNNTTDAKLLAAKRSGVSSAVVKGFIDFQRLKLKPQSERPQLPADVAKLPSHITA